MHQITKLKWLSSRRAVVFAQFIEARCWVKNVDVVGLHELPCESLFIFKFVISTFY